MSDSITSALHSQLSKLAEKDPIVTAKDPIVAALQPYSTYIFFCGKQGNCYLQYVSSCDVADALLKLGVNHGGFLSNM